MSGDAAVRYADIALRYAVACVSIAVAAGLTWLLWPALQPAVALFFAAVMISAWFGGFGPGLFAGLLAAVTAEVLFTSPPGEVEFSVRAVIRLGVFLLSAVLISGLNSRRRNAELRLREAHGELEQRVRDRTAELSTANARLREEVAERQAAEREILEHEAALRELASELALAEERQLRRVAAELHDGIGQLLATAQIRLDLLEQRFGGRAPDAGGSFVELRRLLEEAIARTRSLTVEFSPPVLYEGGLDSALRWLAGVLAERHGVRVQVESDGHEWPVREELRLFLFQAVRELLINVAKHARTDRARVAVHGGGGEIRISVEDDGVGFDPRAPVAPVVGGGGAGAGPEPGGRPASRHSFGLFNIRERLRHYGGRLTIQSAPGRGSRFTIVLPVEPPRPDDGDHRDGPASVAEDAAAAAQEGRA